MIKNLLLYFAVFCAAIQVKATNYYVSSTGNNSNSGLSGKPWKTLTKACASVPINAGHVINVGEGTFTETAIITVPAGVSIIGAGSAKTKILVNHYYTITDYDQWTATTYHAEHFVMQMNGSNQTMKGFSMDGQTRTCVGGIYAQKAVSCIFDDLNIQNFRLSALWLEEGSLNTEVKNCYLKNNSMADAKSGDTGNLLFQFCKNLSIHDNYIEEQGAMSPDLGGYGIKRAQMYNGAWDYENSHFHEAVKIFNNTIIVPTVGGWNNGQAPAIAIEFCGGTLKDVEIYNNNINNTVSLVGNFNMATYSGKTTRVHHNNFNLGHGRYAYAVEANVPGLEIDHNFFNGGLNAIAQWDDRRDSVNFYDHIIHHNIWYDQWKGQAFLHYNKPPTGGKGFQFYNNTLIDNNGISQVYQINTPDFAKADIRNNIFMSNYGTTSRGNVFGTTVVGTLSKNSFYNITAVGSSNVTSNPSIALSGNKPDPFFKLNSGSPCINAGVVITGITDGSVGNPDMGAFESGAIPWTCGIITTSVTEVLSVFQNIESIMIVPNPASDEFEVVGLDIISIHLYDFKGSLIKESTGEKMNISGLSPGLYCVKVEAKNGVKYSKVVKE